MKGKRRYGSWLPAGVILLLVLIWQAVVMLREIPDFLLPSPWQILKAFAENGQTLFRHGLVTALETLAGLGISILLGLGAGLAMGLSVKVRKVFYPLFVISQTVPLIVLAPLLMVWLGFGLLPKIVVVVLVCFFPIAVSFAEGLQQADPDMDDLLRVMGASRGRRLVLSGLPQALPDFFAGLRIAATYSVMGAVLAEWVGASEGLGILMTRYMSSFRTAELFADILLVIGMSLLLFLAVTGLERKFTGWRRNGNETG